MAIYKRGLGLKLDTSGSRVQRSNHSAILPPLTYVCLFSFIDFWNASDTESEVDLQLSTGGMDQEDDDFDFYGWVKEGLTGNIPRVSGAWFLGVQMKEEKVDRLY